jgi:hypothetical protein
MADGRCFANLETPESLVNLLHRQGAEHERTDIRST